MKKFISSVLALIAVFSCFSLFAFADDSVVYLDDGYYILFEIDQDVLIQPNSVDDLKVISGKKTGNIYNGDDELMATVTINGTFEYDGSSAEATKATYNYRIYADDWRFDSGRSYCSGNKAVATVTFDRPLLSNVNATVTLTCSPTGQLS